MIRHQKKIKIVFIMEATLGGTRKHIFELLSRLNKDFFEMVFVYSLKRADPIFLENLGFYREIGIKLYEVSMARGVNIINDITSFFKITRILLKERPHLLHLHAAKAGMLGRLSALLVLPRPKIIYSPHGGSFHDVYGNVGNNISIMLEKLMSPLTDAVINVSNYSSQVYRQKVGLSNEKVVTIYNGVDEDVIQCLPKGTNPERRGDQLTEDRFVLSVVALLLPNKGHSYLLESLRELGQEKTKPKILCYFIGDGPCYDSLIEEVDRKDLGDVVKFVGFQKDVRSWLSISDAVVLPSRAESFGLALVEAMLHKKPVIASRVGGIPEIVEDGKSGILVSPGDTTELKKAIVRLCDNKKERIEMGEHGFRIAKERFSIKAMICETQKLYMSLMNI